ncbi:MAG: hypothetical protein HY461_00580 [Parcubacteria group bacterium]|nr:hypothetical protein [Parcubacteria group bacterium]
MDIGLSAGEAVKNSIVGMINYLLNGLLFLVVQLFSVCVDGLKFLITLGSTMNDRPELVYGWRIVRDTINSFFIVVLIAIAISTIIRFKEYNFRSTLPRLILAAFLVNFSRTLCLLGINASNALMHTFGTAVSDALPILAIGLRLPAVTAFNDYSIGGLFGIEGTFSEAEGEIGSVQLTVTLIFGLIIALVAVGAIAFFLIILLFRVIVLWFLTILSPLAFFLWGVPGRGSSYWGQWLNEYVKHLIVGPVAAFFLYIILTIMIANIQDNYGAAFGGNVPQGTQTLISQPDVLFGYLIGLGMMFIALEIIQQMGVRGGNFAERVGVEGIIKGGLNKAKGLAGYTNDFLASKGLSARPMAAWEALGTGIQNRRNQWHLDARNKWSERASQAEKRGSGLQALLYSAAGENSEFWEKNGLLQIARRAALAPVTGSSKFARDAVSKGASLGRGAASVGRGLKGVYDDGGAGLGTALVTGGKAVGWGIVGAPGAGVKAGWKGLKYTGKALADLSADTEALYTEADALQARDEMRAGLADADARGLVGKYGGLTGAEIKTRLEQAKKHREFEKIATTAADITAMQGANTAAVGAGTPKPYSDEEIKALEAAKYKLETDPELVGYVPPTGTTASDVADIQQLEDVNKLMNDDKFKPHLDASTKLNQVKDKINPAAGKAGSEVSDHARKNELLQRATTRMLRSHVARAGVRSDLALKAEDYQTKRFKDFEEYDPTDLAEVLLGHMNPRDLPEFVGTLRQAGKQGNIGSVLESLRLPGVDGSRNGLQQLMEEAKKRMRIDDNAVNEIKKAIQGYAGKNDELDFSNLVRAGSGGKTKSINDKEAEEKALKKMGELGMPHAVRVKNDKQGKTKVDNTGRKYIEFNPHFAGNYLRNLQRLGDVLSHSGISAEANAEKLLGWKKLIEKGLREGKITKAQVDQMDPKARKKLGLL